MPNEMTIMCTKFQLQILSRSSHINILMWRHLKLLLSKFSHQTTLSHTKINKCFHSLLSLLSFLSLLSSPFCSLLMMIHETEQRRNEGRERNVGGVLEWKLEKVAEMDAAMVMERGKEIEERER